MHAVPSAHINPIIFSKNDWKVLEIGQLENVSHGIVCDVFSCVDNEKALIIVDNCYECEVCVGLRILIVDMHHGHF
jgi:hypothetical protein